LNLYLDKDIAEFSQRRKESQMPVTRGRNAPVTFTLLLLREVIKVEEKSVENSTLSACELLIGRGEGLKPDRLLRVKRENICPINSNFELPSYLI